MSSRASSSTDSAGRLDFKTAYARLVSAPDEHDLAQLIRESLDQLKVMIAGE
jgi:hypothetical protein